MNDVIETPAYQPVPPIRKKLVNHNGGKKHARKPSRILRAMRRVSEQDESADKGTLEQDLRKIKNESPSAFFTRLQKAEADHKRALVTSQRIEAKQSSGAGAAAKPGQPAPEAVDESEERCLALLEELLKTKGWKP